MKAKHELLKFDIEHVFQAISEVYGPRRHTAFCNYLKEQYL